MTKRLVIEPDGWPGELGYIQPGLFVWDDTLCVLSQYGGEAYLCENGDAFAGGVNNKADRSRLIVQPCKATWK